jgi:nicotinamidase-related amidase
MERISRDNAALCLIDHQTGLLTGIRDIAVGELKHNVVALAKAAQILGLPVIVATTAKDELWGPTVPELVAALKGDYAKIDRMTVATHRPRGCVRPWVKWTVHRHENREGKLKGRYSHPASVSAKDSPKRCV